MEKRNGDLVRRLIRKGLLRAVHDLSDGGLILSVIEMALASRVGVFMDDLPEGPAHAILFGEDQARYLIASPQDALDDLDEAAADAGVPYHVLGRAGGCESPLKTSSPST